MATPFDSSSRLILFSKKGDKEKRVSYRSVSVHCYFQQKGETNERMGNPNLPRSPLSIDGLSNNSNNIQRGRVNNPQLIPGPKTDRKHIHLHQVSAHDTVRIHCLKEQR